MASDIYEAAAAKTTAASAAMIAAIVPATLSATVRMPELREIGVFNQSGVAAEIGLGWGTSAPSTPSGTVTVANSQTGSGNTTLVPTYSSYPGAPSTFTRRYDLQAVSGAGVIFTWLPGEWPLWSGATYPAFLIWQISTSAVTYDVYVKVAE